MQKMTITITEIMNGVKLPLVSELTKNQANHYMYPIYTVDILN